MYEEFEIAISKILKSNFKSFLIKTFNHLNPQKEFLDNWHLDLFCEYANALASRDIKRLIINVPPRCLKSICFNVAWPAWLIGNNPSFKIISASYNQTISKKHSMDFQDIISSQWYKKCFAFKIASNTKSKTLTSEHGFRMSSSVGGTITGEGADFLIVDDPLTPMQALSSTFRTRAVNWFKQSFMSRLNDKKDGAVVLIMQRLHKEDLSGLLLEEGGWQHLCLPAIAPKSSKISFGSVQFTRKKGELLHENREGKKEVERAKKELGSVVTRFML